MCNSRTFSFRHFDFGKHCTEEPCRECINSTPHINNYAASSTGDHKSCVGSGNEEP